MKILEPGKGKGWTQEVLCTGKGNGGGGCDAKLLVSPSDLFRTQEFERDGSGAQHITIECVNCTIMTDLDKVPHTISDQVKTTTRPSRRRDI